MKKTGTAFVACLALAASHVHAQATSSYPNKPVRVLIGFTAGSEIDVIGRLITNEMSEKWAQKIVIDNRTGAGGTVAGAIAAKANPDGYTLFFNSVSHTASLALYPNLPYDPGRDFAAVSQATSAPNVLLAAPTQSAKTVKEMIEAARQKPGQVNFGSAGVGSGTHIAGEMFWLGAKIKVSHVPYKGVPEVINDTVSGRIQYSFAPIGNVLPFVKEKRVLALAVSTITRSPSLPDTPTIAEAAVAGYDWDQWYGMFAPAQTPRAVVQQVSKEMVRVLALPHIKEHLATRGSVPKPSTPEEFGKFVRTEIDKVTRVIREGGIKLD
jgi:tripartite-type tricarboxylate transporter receptor subunit TctC